VLGAVSRESRKWVDRRVGAERRSTLERRSHSARHAYTESPTEYLRNALQFLTQLTSVIDLDPDSHLDLASALDRVRHALGLLERRTRA
jgi:hypothetical protein